MIRDRDTPLQPAGTGTAVLRGNLTPRGALVKQSAARPALLVHRGRALVWDDYESYLRDADDPDLDVSPADIAARLVETPGVPWPGDHSDHI